MATFGEMKTAIARRLVDDSNTAVTEVEIGTAINEAINFWKQKKFWFNTASADLSIAAADTTVTLPANFLSTVARNPFTVTESGYAHPVQKLSPETFDMLKNTATTGRPRAFCYRDGALEFIPAANIDYSGRLHYLIQYDDFETDGTDDNNSNVWTLDDKGKRLIQNDALARLHGELRHDEKMEERYQAKTAAEYGQLMAATNARLKTGTLTVEQ